MNDRIQLYFTSYAVGVVVFVVSLFWPILQIPYLLMYFLVSGLFVFTTQPVPTDPQRSSVRHFELSSRYNWINYVIAGFLILGALLVSWLPVPPNITTLVLWSLSVGGIYYIVKKYGAVILQDLVRDYLVQQNPDVSKESVSRATALLMQQPDMEVSKLAAQSQITADQADRISQMFKIYFQNNLE